jgi:hypothetical protein
MEKQQKDVLDKTVQFLQKREGIDKVHMVACHSTAAAAALLHHVVCFRASDTSCLRTNADPEDHPLHLQAYSSSQSPW